MTFVTSGRGPCCSNGGSRCRQPAALANVSSRRRSSMQRKRTCKRGAVRAAVRTRRPVRPARDLEIRKSKCRTLVCLAQTTGKHHLQVTIPIMFHLCKSICHCPIERTSNQLCTTQLQQVGHCSGSQAKNGIWMQNSRCQSAPIGAVPQLIHIPMSVPAPVLMPPRSAAQ